MISHSKPTLGEDEIKAVDSVLRSGHLAQGVEVEAFETECAAVCGRRYGVAVNSGTAALHLGLVALKVGVGTPVAIPSYACAALTTAVRLQDATPVLCDINDDYNLDPASIPASAAWTPDHVRGDEQYYRPVAFACAAKISVQPMRARRSRRSRPSSS